MLLKEWTATTELKFCFSHRANKTKSASRSVYDWSVLKKNREIYSQYTITNLSCHKMKMKKISKTAYNNFVTRHTEVAKVIKNY